MPEIRRRPSRAGAEARLMQLRVPSRMLFHILEDARGAAPAPPAIITLPVQNHVDTEAITSEGVMGVNERLQRVFDQTWSSYAVLPHTEAYTAPDVAESARVRGWQLAKVVVVRDGQGADFMVVLPATRNFDFHVLHEVTGRVAMRLEDEQELERLFPDCEVGAMPPFGALYGMPMYVDPCLLKEGDIFFQAGNHHEVVLMRVEDYERIARPFFSSTCLHREHADIDGNVTGRPVFSRRERIGLVRSS